MFKLHDRRTFIYLCNTWKALACAHTYFSGSSKNLAAVCLSEDGTEHSDVNFKASVVLKTSLASCLMEAQVLLVVVLGLVLLLH